MTTRITPGVGANLLGQHSAERNQDATVYVGNLDPQEIKWKCFDDLNDQRRSGLRLVSFRNARSRCLCNLGCFPQFICVAMWVYDCVRCKELLGLSLRLLDPRQLLYKIAKCNASNPSSTSSFYNFSVSA